MKHGSVYQRHLKACPRGDDGVPLPHRCRGPWAYVLEYGRDNNGKRLQTTKSGFPTKSAARAALQERVTVLMTDVGSHTLTVAEYLDNWLAGKHALKPTTLDQYRDFTNACLKPRLGAVRLLELRAHHLDAMYLAINLDRRGRPLSPATLRRIHAVLRSALGTAVKRRLIPYNPADHVELAPENPKRPRPWTPEQCQRFLDVISGDRLAALYELMLVTGMRRGEAIGLRWDDVDLPGQALLIVQQLTDVRGRSVIGTPKTKRGSRIIPIDQETATILRRHQRLQRAEQTAAGLAWVSTGLVFTRVDGRELRPEYAARHFQGLARRAGLPAIRLHDLRHTNASLALAAGVPLKVVSERLGHSQTAITADLYTHVNVGVGRTAAAQIASTLRRAVGPSSETVPSRFLAPTDSGALSDRPNGATHDGTSEAPDSVSAGQGPAP